MTAIYVALLHESMLDKQGSLVTTSLTLLDLHDISRSSRTYGVKGFYAAHPAPAMRELALTLTKHWSEGFGSTYNPDRKDALSILHVEKSFADVVENITQHEKKAPLIVGTSARRLEHSVSFSSLRETFQKSEAPVLLLFGTGWGMSEELLAKADVLLEPIHGPTEYNHLSVRSACAIILDRLLA